MIFSRLHAVFFYQRQARHADVALTPLRLMPPILHATRSAMPLFCQRYCDERAHAAFHAAPARQLPLRQMLRHADEDIAAAARDATRRLRRQRCVSSARDAAAPHYYIYAFYALFDTYAERCHARYMRRKRVCATLRHAARQCQRKRDDAAAAMRHTRCH